MGRSTNLTYRVEPEEMHWVVTFGGLHCGRFTTRLDAIRAAVADARRVSEMGHHTEVQVQRRNGTCRNLLSLSNERMPGIVSRGTSTLKR